MRLFNTSRSALSMVSANTPGKENTQIKTKISNMEITGTIAEIGEPVQVTERLTKREFVLSIPDENYPQEVSFETVNKNTAKLDNVNVGDTVTVTFDLRGRRVTLKNGEEKVFNTLSAWGISVLNQQEQPEVAETADGLF